MTFSRILHPVEYSDEGRLAAAQAFALARSYQTDLHVVHVRSRRDPTERESAEQTRLREFVSQSNPDQATFESVILYGDPVSAVAEYAQSTAPDLVVVGKTGRRGSSLWRTGVYARELRAPSDAQRWWYKPGRTTQVPIRSRRSRTFCVQLTLPRRQSQL